MLSKMDVLIVRGLCHHFQDFFWFLMLKMVLNDLGGMFEVILLLQNKFRANHTPPSWYCMMDKYLLAFLSIKNSINPDQISNSIWRNVASNLQGTCTVLHCCLQTLIVVPLSSPSANNLPSARAKYFQFWLISPEHLLSFFCTPVLMFSCVVAWPCFHEGGMAVWPWRPLLARPVRTVDVCTWDSLVSAWSELMALPDIFQHPRKISSMCFSSFLIIRLTTVWLNPWRIANGLIA